MSKIEKAKKIIYSAATIFIMVLLLFLLVSRISPREISPPQTREDNTSQAPIKQPKNKVRTVLEIDGTKYEEEISDPISVYDFMSQLQKERKIKFTEKNYIGIGKFISEIDGIGGDGEKNWIYYVNGLEAKIGVSNYVINPGDVVSWKYEKNY